MPTAVMAPELKAANILTFEFLKQLSAKTGGVVELLSDKDDGKL
jgi:hypothetical protein